MQAQLTSVQWQHNPSAAKPLPTALINFVVRVRSAHLISLPLMVAAPIVLAFFYDNSAAMTLFGTWARGLIKPIYEYYPYPIYVHFIGFLMVVVTSFLMDYGREQGVHWLMRGATVFIASLCAMNVLYVFATYALAFLVVIPTLLLGGLGISLAATFIILAIFRSDRRNPADEAYPQPYLSQQSQAVTLQEFVDSVRHSQASSYFIMPAPPYPHQQHPELYYPQPSEDYRYPSLL